MRNRVGLLGVAFFVSLCLAGMTAPAGAQTPEFRGFWADVWGVGFRSTTDIDTMVSRAVQGRYNAIFPELLAYHDNRSGAHGAYWNSSVLPKATDITGDIDPLAYLCQKAHEQGLEVHVWLVPFRACLFWPPTGNATLQAHPEWVMTARAAMGAGPSTMGDTTSEAYYLDPGSPDVQDYIISILRELVANYPIDGIHWDYIRYIQTDGGYPARTWYTKSGLERFKRITGYSGTPAVDDASWCNFRRREITELIRRARAEIPSIANPRQPLRHSAALITWGGAPATFPGSNSWALFQNWEEWQRLGYLDMAIPMTYFDHSAHPSYYTSWVDKAMVWRYDRHMVVGPGLYLNTFANSLTQMQYARSKGANGLCTYCYRETRNDSGSVWDWYPYVAANFFTASAPLPTMPWRNQATATEGTLWGRVTDASTGAPIDDATVQVGSMNPVQTDGSGYYVITLVPATAGGTNYLVTASKTGYPSAAHSGIPVTAGGIRREDLALGSTGNAPVIIQHPSNQLVAPGATALFTVQAAGDDPLAYRWQKNAVNLSDGGKIAGATLATLQIANADPSDEGNYRCVVTNALGSATSNAATLTINSTPVTFIVESRSGGQNYANFAQANVWSQTTSKSSAGGTTAGIGSLYASLVYSDRTATYSFTPTTTGTYEVFVTWVTSANACSSAKHVVTHGGGSATLYKDQLAGGNQWNSLGQYTLNANTAYTVTQYSGGSSGGSIIRADAVKWSLIGGSSGNPPLITQHPADQTTTAGSTVAFGIQATGDAPLSYQWQKNGANLSNGGKVSGATTANLQITSADSSDQAGYRCVVTNPYGTATSNSATLTINSNPVVFIVESRTGGQNYASYSDNTGWSDNTAKSTAPGVTAGIGSRLTYLSTSGANAIFTFAPSTTGTYEVFVTGPYSTNTPSIAHHIVTNAGTSADIYIDQNEASNPGYSTRWNSLGQYTLNAGAAYSVTITTTGSLAGTGSTALRSDAVKWQLVSGTPPPTITQHPAAQNVCAGATATFSVTATGQGTLTYQWQKNSANLANGGHYSGVTTTTLTVSTADANDVASYRCVVTNAGGSTNSNAAALSLKTATAISQHPQAQQVAPGATATFTVAATGDGTLTYQWQKNSVNLSNGGHYSGVTTATLTVSSADSNDVATYRCVVTGGCGSATSNGAALSLIPAPTITQHPAAQNVCAGATATFSVTATGQGTLTYQWQKNSVNLANGGHYSGVTTSTLTVSTADANDVASYRCVVTNAGGSTNSNAAALSLKAATAISQHPQAQQVAPGATATFTVTATGSGTLTYQWQKNSTNVGNGGHYSGVTTATLTVSSADSNDVATYRCVVTGGCGSATSNGAALTLVVPPTLVAALSRKTHGDAGVFDVADLGSGAVESRQGGPTQVLVTFDKAIQQVNGTLADVQTDQGAVTSLSINGSVLEVGLTGAVGPQAVTLSFPGIADAANPAAVVTGTLCSRVLTGDVQGDGLVNIFDMVTVRNNLNLAVAAGNFACDVNVDGAINLFDLVLVRNNLNAVAGGCP